MKNLEETTVVDGADGIDVSPVLGRMLLRNMASSMPVSLANAGVAAILLLAAIDWPLLAGWFVAMAVLALGRRVFCRFLLKENIDTTRRHIMWLTGASAAAGAGWGVLPFLVGPDAPAISLHIIVFMIAGMTAGAALSFASHVNITRAINAPALLLLGTCYVLSGGFENFTMVLVLAFYFAATDMFARRARRNLVATLKNREHAERQRCQIAHQKTALNALAENYKRAAERAGTAESGLIQKSAELALIFDNVPVRIWCKDDNNKILRLNRAAAKSMGLAVEKATGANTYDLFPDMAKKYHDDDLSVIQSGEPKLGIVEEYTPANGEKGWVRTDKVPYTDPETGRRLIFVAATDISELHKAQKELQHANEELAQFARIASHDLQEPLKKLAIHGASLKKLSNDTMPESARGEVNQVLETAERMRALVNDVLNLARMPSTRLELQAVAPSECIDVANHTLGFAGRAGLEFIAHTLPEVMADPSLLTRIYQNLISNAAKFSSENHLAQIEFTAETKGDSVILGVKDNGVGLDPAYAERIFEPLVRVHDRHQYEGTGIGLAICKKGVERMGGRIWVETSPGQGAHFRFQLAQARKTQAAA